MIKKVLAVLAVVACALGASAQGRWGVTGGLTVTDLHWKQSLFGVDQVCGGSAGVVAELMFPGIGFGIDTGALYEMRGARMHLGDKLLWSSEGYTDPRLFLHELDIPIHLRFKWTRLNGLEEYIAPLIYAGPEFSFLLGHSKCDAIKWAGGDVGITIGIGAEIYKRWQITGSYTWGMTYALRTQLLTNMSAQNRTWDIRVAYFF